MRRFIGLAAIFPLLAFASRESDLAKGKILTTFQNTPESKYQTVVSEGVIHAPMKSVWNVIVDFAQYPKVIPRMVSSRVLEATADHVRYAGHIGMPWPIDDVRYECLARLPTAQDGLDFAMVPGTGVGVKNFSGTWRLSRYQGRPNETLAVYTLYFEPLRNYPAWVMRMGSRATIEKTQESLRARIRSLETMAR